MDAGTSKPNSTLFRCIPSTECTVQVISYLKCTSVINDSINFDIISLSWFENRYPSTHDLHDHFVIAIVCNTMVVSPFPVLFFVNLFLYCTVN